MPTPGASSVTPTHDSTLTLYDNISTLSPPLPHLTKSLSTLDAALRLYTPTNLAVAFNGGKDATVVLHLTLAALANYLRSRPNDTSTPTLTCLYLLGPSEDNFSQVNDFVRHTVQTTPQINCLQVHAGIKDGIQQFVSSRSGLCAFVMGTRRTDPHGSTMEQFEPSSPGWAPFMRVNPILDWSYQNVWHFLRTFKIPFCPLYQQGYTSIGSVATTSPNPALRYITGDQVLYHPAWCLQDETLERAGRVKRAS